MCVKLEAGWGGPSIMLGKKVPGYYIKVKIVGTPQMKNQPLWVSLTEEPGAIGGRNGRQDEKGG